MMNFSVLRQVYKPKVTVNVCEIFPRYINKIRSKGIQLFGQKNSLPSDSFHSEGCYLKIFCTAYSQSYRKDIWFGNNSLSQNNSTYSKFLAAGCISPYGASASLPKSSHPNLDTLLLSSLSS